MHFTLKCCAKVKQRYLCSALTFRFENVIYVFFNHKSYFSIFIRYQHILFDHTSDTREILCIGTYVHSRITSIVTKWAANWLYDHNSLKSGLEPGISSEFYDLSGDPRTVSSGLQFQHTKLRSWGTILTALQPVLRYVIIFYSYKVNRYIPNILDTTIIVLGQLINTSPWWWRFHWAGIKNESISDAKKAEDEKSLFVRERKISANDTTASLTRQQFTVCQ